MINLLFSMLGPRLTDEQAGAFSAFAQWVVLNERDGQLLVDGIGDQGDVERVVAMLTAAGRAPALIGAWHHDGTPVAGFPLDEAAWLEVAPDEIDAEGVPHRPVAFAEIHGWAGWEPKELA